VLSSEYGFTEWLAWGNIMRGWTLVEQGQEEELNKKKPKRQSRRQKKDY
jgi:hypothetical protein